MKALIINLDSATKRMDFQRKQLFSLNIKFERLAAFKIVSTSDKLYQTYHDRWQRPLTVSELSCFFSHKKAWDIIVKKNEPMLVLEDDAWLSENVPNVLKKIEQFLDIDYVTLEVTGSNSRKLIANKAKDSFCEVSLFRLYQGRSGAGAYVLWPSGARKLLNEVEKGNIGLADKFINANYELEAFQIEPAIVIQLDQCQFYNIKPPLNVKTSISTKTNITINFFDLIQYKLKRLLGEIRVGINLFQHKHHAVRRSIALSSYFKESKF